jgi:hypothetical protein
MVRKKMDLCHKSAIFEGNGMKLSIVFFIIPLTLIGVKEGILHNTE